MTDYFDRDSLTRATFADPLPPLNAADVMAAVAQVTASAKRLREMPGYKEAEWLADRLSEGTPVLILVHPDALEAAKAAFKNPLIEVRAFRYMTDAGRIYMIRKDPLPPLTTRYIDL
jgi:hypothetical protein